MLASISKLRVLVELEYYVPIHVEINYFLKSYLNG